MSTTGNPKDHPIQPRSPAGDIHDTDPTAVFVRTLGDEPASSGRHPEIPVIRAGKPGARTFDELNKSDAGTQAEQETNWRGRRRA